MPQSSYSVSPGLLTVDISPDYADLLEGQSQLITCTITGEPAATAIIWYFTQTGSSEQRTLSTGNTAKYYGGNVQYPSLTILNFQSFDGGTYVCSATNEVGQCNSTSSVLRFISDLSITASLTTYSSIVGDSIATIMCKINGTPPAFEWEWTKTPLDGGAALAPGEPEISKPVEYEVGKLFILTCSSTGGNPKPSVLWLMDDIVILSGTSTSTSGNVTSTTLIVTTTTDSDLEMTKISKSSSKTGVMKSPNECCAHVVIGVGEPVCNYGGKEYRQDETWSDGCQFSCVCNDAKAGQYQCKEKCPKWELPEVCHWNAAPAGKCCLRPECPAPYVITEHLCVDENQELICAFEDEVFSGLFYSWALDNCPNAVHYIDPITVTVQQLADFFLHLFEEKGYSPSTIKGYRSAIARTISLSGGSDFGDNEFLSLLIKNFCLNRPRQRRLVPSWDLGLVLKVLQFSPFEPLHSASFKFLSYKCCFLIALATGRRRSEIHALSISESCLRFAADKSSVTLLTDPSFLAKNQLPDKGSGLITIPALPPTADNQVLCPVRALLVYLASSAKLRSAGSSRLFIPIKKGISDISAKTISTWICNTVILAYKSASSEVLVKHQVKAHEVRALASSWNIFNSSSMSEIMSAGFWRSDSAFYNHYLRSMPLHCDNLYSLGPLVAAQQVVFPPPSDGDSALR
ncbi:unnamed protein product [Mytilus edulis]|uniref:Ig-like domain-containing protein n=1 Tax=Mytilus edulis TaxID=6550 RepID=A0A8S3UED3_MYTED|nr:unnamed protein product [Mytilus edulis]